MISFKRENHRLQISVESELSPTANAYHLYWDCHDACYADLLAKHLNNLLVRKLKAARREAYEQGYKDSKAKRKKETWFSGGLN